MVDGCVGDTFSRIHVVRAFGCPIAKSSTNQVNVSGWLSMTG